MDHLSYKCHNIVTYGPKLISPWIRCFGIVTLPLGESSKQDKAVDGERILVNS